MIYGFIVSNIEGDCIMEKMREGWGIREEMKLMFRSPKYKATLYDQFMLDGNRRKSGK